MDKQAKTEEMNAALSITINNQTNKIKKLENQNEDLKNQNLELTNSVSKLEEKNKQLETKIDKLNNNSTKPVVNTSGGLFKSYTDYKCLSRNSAQWKLQEQAYTDSNGLRKIGDAYLVALGSYYGTHLGTKYTVTLSNGNVFQVILCDCKKNIHTDSKNQTTLTDGSILEFYVDASKLPESVKLSGSVGSIKFFAGEVISIVKV
jgi:hypothetical protein